MNSKSQSAIASIQSRNLSKSIQTLLGICTGLTADDRLNDREIHFLSVWLKDNEDASSTWPGSEISRRIQIILEDGVITDDERNDLLRALKKLTGNYFSETGASESESIGIEFDSSEIIFPNNIFCMTGQFMHGTRSNCQRIIEKLGGINSNNISRKTNYLIIGSVIEPNWMYQSYGRKIEAAMQLRNEQSGISIASEKQWLHAINALDTM